MPTLELRGISAAYGETRVLSGLDLTAREGEFVALLGESGCGKTTTLRVVAGFLKPDSGAVLLDGRDYTPLAPNRRGFGYVFQSYALFPHLNVFDNVAFGLRQRRLATGEVRHRVGEILDVVGLATLADRYAKALSGGQKQRVALARALVIKPDLLLFDEPLSNLDAKLRVKMRVEIRRLQQAFNITTLYVTHDQEECFSICDKVTVMNRGAIEQFDTPERIYAQPASEFVARFVGFENFVRLTPTGTTNGRHALTADDGTVLHATTTRQPPTGGTILGALRPDGLSLQPGHADGADDADGTVIPGRVEFRTYLGRGYQYIVATSLGSLTVNAEGGVPAAPGDNVTLTIAPDRLVLLGA